MDARKVARSLAFGRIALGAGLIAAPAQLTAGWVGDETAGAGARVLANGLGARDVTLGAGLLRSLDRGGAQPWLVASAVADVADLAATVARRRQLPALGVVGVGALAGSAALLAAYLSTRLAD